MKKVWTPEMLNRLREQYPTADLDTLAKELGVTKNAVKTKAVVIGVKRASRFWVWSEERTKRLIELYPEHTNREIAEVLGVSESSVSIQAFDLRLFKSEDFHRRKREAGMFKKGCAPPNKGKKWDEFMSPQGQENSRKTTFKKGNIPPNHRQVGSERITRDGYIEIKIQEPNVFKLKHRIIWEEHNGPIPKGYNIQFRDKNPLNCSIDNLYMISRSEQMNENTIMRYPENLRTAIKRVSKIKKLINQQ